MGQEYFINSQELQDKVSNLLPSQGGAGAGIDLSASTQIIPIIDLTESAEGSNFRQDLQRALSHGSSTEFQVTNATTTIINNTGYYQISGTCTVQSASVGSFVTINITDGTTSKIVWGQRIPANSSFQSQTTLLDIIVFLEAGDSCTVTSFNAASYVIGSTRQIATITGELVNP